MKMKKCLVLLLAVAISLFLVACGGDSIKENSGTDNKNEFIVAGGNNTVGNELEAEGVKPNTQEYTKQYVTEETTKDEYYIILKEAWQLQKDYVDSIDDPTAKQSVQTPESATIMESNRLLTEHPEDSESIDRSLERVLNGE